MKDTIETKHGIKIFTLLGSSYTLVDGVTIDYHMSTMYGTLLGT